MTPAARLLLVLALLAPAPAPASRVAPRVAPRGWGQFIASPGVAGAGGGLSVDFASALSLPANDLRVTAALGRALAAAPFPAELAASRPGPESAALVRAALAASWQAGAPARARALTDPDPRTLNAEAPVLAAFQLLSPALPEPTRVDAYLEEVGRRRGADARRMVEAGIGSWQSRAGGGTDTGPVLASGGRLSSWTRRAASLAPASLRSGARHGRAPPAALAGPAPAAGAALDAATVSELGELSRLEPQRAAALVERLRGVDVPEPRALPYGDKDTFSLELEFLVKRQLDAAAMSRLFPAGRLDADEWSRWDRAGQLPARAWSKARQAVLRGVRRAIPAGWRISDESTDRGGAGNTQELQTANRGRVYHRNTPQDWDELAAGLERAQAAMPGGLYSAHVHIGRAGRWRWRWDGIIPRRAIAVDQSRFVKSAVVFEALWRGLMGVPFERISGSHYLSFDLLHPSEREALDDALTTHSNHFNISEQFPTVENKLVTALFDGYGGAALDPARLRTDLWPAFAFVDMALRKGDLPLATLGAPAIQGERPTLKQIARFLDLVYGDDAVGKAIALKKLTSLPQGPPANPLERASRRRRVDSVYRRAGLSVVLELHRAHDGYDERLAEHLLADDGALLARVAADMASARLRPSVAASFFPEELRGPLRVAMGAPARVTPLARLSEALRDAFVWLLSPVFPELAIDG
ncbi:MAG: hypothetical protein SF051_08940 [Elusimicrobiota bacterium]|nr:hypothetical protein [Elusimicrobiota bacterium]